jgi:hypothetical protein
VHSSTWAEQGIADGYDEKYWERIERAATELADELGARADRLRAGRRRRRPARR